MGEYDAFGRKVGEDPLADAGWRDDPPGVESVEAQPTTVAGEAEPEPEQATPPQIDQVVAATGRRLVRLLVVLVTVGVAGSALYSVAQFADDAGGELEFDIPRFTVPQLTPDEPATAARGLEPGSLLRPGPFATALERVRATGPGRLRHLRLAADRLDAQILTRGRLRSVQVAAGGEVRELSTSGPGFGALPTMAYSAVETDAPRRFVRAAARQRGVSPARVDYLVVGRFGDEISWSLYFRDGTHATADAAGRVKRLVSG